MKSESNESSNCVIWCVAVVGGVVHESDDKETNKRLISLNLTSNIEK